MLRTVSTKTAVSCRETAGGVMKFRFAFPYAGIIQIRFKGCNLRRKPPPKCDRKFINQTLINRVDVVKDNSIGVMLSAGYSLLVIDR